MEVGYPESREPQTGSRQSRRETQHTMYSTTGLTVGLAIGIPTFVFLAVISAFWYRQRLRYKRDLREHENIEDYDEVNDLDMDHIIDTPKESHLKDFSTDELAGPREPGARAEQQQDGDTDVVIKHGSYSIRKNSKIMGLRLISVDGGSAPAPPSKHSQRVLSRSIDELSKQQTESKDKNYKAFYESMLPVFADEAGGYASSLNETGEAKPNAPLTPTKDAHNSTSSMHLYKLLQEDSPMYPNSRITSAIAGDSPLRSRNSLAQLNGSSASTNVSTAARSDARHGNVFDSPKQPSDYRISPFDTPPRGKALDLGDKLEASGRTQESPDEDTGQDYHHHHSKDDSQDLVFDASSASHHESGSETTSAVQTSPTRLGTHRRFNSGDSRVMIESDRAEENYNKNRREWLESYRKI